MSGEETNNWTEIIEPKNHFFNLRLKEIWRYRDLLFLFVKRDMQAQYKQTILGPLWHILQPALTTVIFVVLFSNIAKIPTDGVPPVIFYMCGLTIWNYFAACFTATSNTFITNAGIFGKVYFPRLILPLSVVASNLIRFAIQLTLLVAVIIWYAVTANYSIQLGANILLVPVIVIVMAGMGLGFGIIVSSLTTKYRDVAVLISFGVQLLLFITPVAYPLSYLEQSGYKTFIALNPLSALTEGFRYAVLGKGDFTTSSFLYSCSCMLAAILFGALLFNKVEKTFMDTV